MFLHPQLEYSLSGSLLRFFMGPSQAVLMIITEPPGTTWCPIFQETVAACIVGALDVRFERVVLLKLRFLNPFDHLNGSLLGLLRFDTFFIKASSN